ncbi:MAG: hypothetical protein ABJB16_00200 [Saprospiraceae bacterium]
MATDISLLRSYRYMDQYGSIGTYISTEAIGIYSSTEAIGIYSSTEAIGMYSSTDNR